MLYFPYSSTISETFLIDNISVLLRKSSIGLSYINQSSVNQVLTKYNYDKIILWKEKLFVIHIHQWVTEGQPKRTFRTIFSRKPVISLLWLCINPQYSLHKYQLSAFVRERQILTLARQLCLCIPCEHFQRQYVWHFYYQTLLLEHKNAEYGISLFQQMDGCVCNSFIFCLPTNLIELYWIKFINWNNWISGFLTQCRKNIYLSISN